MASKLLGWYEEKGMDWNEDGMLSDADIDDRMKAAKEKAETIGKTTNKKVEIIMRTLNDYKRPDLESAMEKNNEVFIKKTRQKINTIKPYQKNALERLDELESSSDRYTDETKRVISEKSMEKRQELEAEIREMESRKREERESYVQEKIEQAASRGRGTTYKTSGLTKSQINVRGLSAEDVNRIESAFSESRRESEEMRRAEQKEEQ